MQTLYMACKALHNLFPASKFSICYSFAYILGWSHIEFLFECAKLVCSFLRAFSQTPLFTWNILFQILTWLAPFCHLGSVEITPSRVFHITQLTEHYTQKYTLIYICVLSHSHTHTHIHTIILSHIIVLFFFHFKNYLIYLFVYLYIMYVPPPLES